jgi:hypothetical protein
MNILEQGVLRPLEKLLSAEEEDQALAMADWVHEREIQAFEHVFGKSPEEMKDEYKEKLKAKIFNKEHYKKRIMSNIVRAKKLGRNAKLMPVSILANEREKTNIPEKYRAKVEVASKLAKPTEWQIQQKIMSKHSKPSTGNSDSKRNPLNPAR